MFISTFCVVFCLWQGNINNISCHDMCSYCDINFCDIHTKFLYSNSTKTHSPIPRLVGHSIRVKHITINVWIAHVLYTMTRLQDHVIIAVFIYYNIIKSPIQSMHAVAPYLPVAPQDDRVSSFCWKYWRYLCTCALFSSIIKPPCFISDVNCFNLLSCSSTKCLTVKVATLVAKSSSNLYND